MKISGKLDETSATRMAIVKNNIQLQKILNKIVINTDIETKQDLLNKWLTIKFEKEFDYTIV